MEGFFHDEEDEIDHPIRYVPIGHLYSSTAACIKPSGSSNVMSKKVKARKLADDEEKEMPVVDLDRKRLAEKPLLVYSRRFKKPRGTSFFETLARRMEPGLNSAVNKTPRKRWRMKKEMISLGLEIGSHVGSSGRRLRGSGSCQKIEVLEKRKITPGKEKRWVELEMQGVDPDILVGLTCKVYWPMDEDWYRGSVTGYDPATGKHSVEYDDGDNEHLILMNESIKFHMTSDEMQSLNLNLSNPSAEKKMPNYNEMLALAISFDDCQDLEPGDIVWAKLTGHAMWPAVIVNESNVGASRNLNPIRREQSILVQFFGTHDFARISLRQGIPFVNGLLSSLHLKCKKKWFPESLEEAKLYLSNQKLPESMLRLQRCTKPDDCKGAFGNNEDDIESCEEFSGDEARDNVAERIRTYPIEIGDLRVTNLGKIVCDSDYFRNKQEIWPDGYTAFRKFTSIKDTKSTISYKMEVLRSPKSKGRPLFRVTSDDGDQIDGPNPTTCWKEIYNRIRKKQCNGFHNDVEGRSLQKSGSYMFGFSNPKISELIQELPNSRSCSKLFKGYWDPPAGYKAVNVDWKDLDRCSVCHMDEEYAGNLFLQCDKCRMMVHARCYGELEPLDGVLWFCNLCRPGAPRRPPPCCLCPVVGGAIKPTTDGRWAHLTCAMWIPETCLLDVKKMEPIDGLSRVNKDRWKLLCSICGVPYGACIQCSNSTCRVAYHPLCARAAGLCVELEDEDKLHLISVEEDDDQCIRLLSFCKKHRQPSNERPLTDESLTLSVQHASNYVPALNSSGCARCEPYDFFGRRGQKEPQVLASASVKRLYVENRPYLVSGYRQNGAGFSSLDHGSLQAICGSGAPKLKAQYETSGSICSMPEKYNVMKATFRKRLAFGKSRIHGFGVFTKLAHKKGDMIIEYTGEIVRPPIADLRERRVYNSLVGAGTYMFRIDDERVIDATRAGSIAHLINHSCDPNCYSRVINVNGDDRIIIYAKQDINKWEELTYDYRFFSIDEQLACFCGFPTCRRVVNDVEAEEQVATILVPRTDLIPWTGE